MTARIIVVANQKGGVGKSTVAMGVAGCLASRGFRTLVVDADPQGTSSGWAAAAPDERPFPAAVISLAAAGSKVHRELRPHLDNYDRVLIDCPPSLDSPVSASAMLVADIALIPVPLSPPDLWATRGVVKLIEQAQTVNEDLRAYLVANRVQRTSISDQVKEVIADFGIPLLKSRLGLRTAFQEAVVEGGTVAGLGASAKAAAAEMDKLVDEIEKLLAKRKKEAI